MLQQQLPQADDHGRQTLRTKQNGNMELLVAASEADIMCAGWLFDQRVDTELLMS